MPRSLVLLLAARLVATPAWADDAAGPRGDDDGIWAWVDRLDGDEPSAERQAALDEAVDVDLVEQVLLEGYYAHDLPDDYYRDPKRVLTPPPRVLGLRDDHDLPMVRNEHVERWIEVLTGPGRGYMKRWLERKERWAPLIEEELEAAGLPKDLIYLAMVESGFNPHAYSHAHAAGMWQFIPSTGRMYGLAVDFWLDERRDPVKSTKAAVAMLSELHGRFDDWYLAFAAYNTGGARVRRALGRAEGTDTPDYWTLLEQDLIHRETAGYVPKILAAAIIGHDPEAYGFTDLEPEEAYEVELVHVDDAVDVAVLARCADMDEEAFRHLNPAIRKFAIPSGGVDLAVPVGRAAAFLTALAEVPDDEKRQLVLHHVSRGESLSGIAARYGVSVKDVVSTNRLRDANHLSIGQKLVIPVAGSAGDSAALATSRQAPPTARDDARPAVTKATTATVRRGDSLSQIAARHGVSMADLQRWNDLDDPSKILVGQTLRLTAPDRPAAVASTGGRPKDPASATYTVRSGDSPWAIARRHDIELDDFLVWNGMTRASTLRVGQRVVVSSPRAAPAPAVATRASTYTVRAGDTLSGIAAKHGVAMADLQDWNGLKDPSALRVGQTLRLELPDASWTDHVVRSGESLGLIARRYGVQVRDLQAWNELQGSVIHPGDTLRVKRR